MKTNAKITVPRYFMEDTTMRLVEWVIAEGQEVHSGDLVAYVETSKATLEILSEQRGYLHHQVEEGAHVSVGDSIAFVSADPQARPAKKKRTEKPTKEGPVITEKAKALLEKHGLTAKDFPHLSVVRSSDIIKGQASPAEEKWDEVFQSPKYQNISGLLTQLRRRMKAKYNRHVSTGELLYDRWEMAKDHDFGPGSSIYDACLLLGKVKVGKDCWVGPFTVLDAAHAPLEIGDHTSIGSGTQIYTHNTIQRVLTGGKQKVFSDLTKIGKCCFISPNCVIGAGTSIGDHSFIAAGSYVEGVFPPFSYIAGNPAKKIGVVEIKEGRAILRRTDSELT